LAQAKAESVTTMAVNGYGIDLRRLLLQMPFDGVQFN
jgi:hypothetical protein